MEIAIGLILFLFALLALIFFRQRNPQKKTWIVPDRHFSTGEYAEEAVPAAASPYFPELPPNYAETGIRLMVRDPEWLYAYWEIDRDRFEGLQYEIGRLVSGEDVTLLLCEIAPGSDTKDIFVGQGSGEWHIRAGKPDTSFYCQAGIRHGGTFHVLAVSNPVTTPRSAVSEQYDEEWMLVDDHEQLLLKRIGASFGVSSPLMYRKEDH